MIANNPQQVTGPHLTLRQRAALLLYGLVMRAMQPLLRRKLKRRGRQEPNYLLHTEQRFGCYQEAPPLSGRVWVHAVSLGETRAAALLIEALRLVAPDVRFLLTHSTATGWAQGQSLLRRGDAQAWLPWDTPAATARFLRHHQPALGLLMETEVWPQLVQSCQWQGVPLWLVNARLSEGSKRKALQWSSLSRPAYQGLTAVYAQSDSDASRLRELGAPVRGVLGNLKFDLQDQPFAVAQAATWRKKIGARPVIMFASSREGEEQLWLDALAADPARAERLRRLGVLWLLVPRHPQRFEVVHALLLERSLTVYRRSALPKDDLVAWPQAALQAQVWLGDSLGEMPLYYSLSDTALLGGSFLPLGGQNLIEAAAFSCPIVMGPHTFNFSEAADQAQALGAAARVADLSAALNQIMHWIDDTQARAQAQIAGRQMVAQSRGAAQRLSLAVRDTLAACGKPKTDGLGLR